MPPRSPQPPGPSTAHRLVASAAEHAGAGRMDAAVAAARQALAHGAGGADADLLRTIANVLAAAGQNDAAVYQMERALKARPGDPLLHEHAGRLYLMLGRADPAIAALMRSMDLRPRGGEALLVLLSLLDEAGREDDLLSVAAAALRTAPTWAAMLATAYALHRVGGPERVAARLGRLAELLRGHPSSGAARLARAQPMLYPHGLDEETVFAAHRDAGAALGGLFPQLPEPLANTREPDRPLRIGYVSQDFRGRSAGHFIEGLITGHQLGTYQPYCYHHTLGEDALTQRLRGAATWRDIRALDDLAVARLVRDDRIDVLVDLTGHTGSGRLAPFALRAAPVQVAYMGYPHTTGLATMNARLVDTHTDPAGAERHATERLIRLEPCFLCYTPPDHAPDVKPRSPFTTGIVFGSFNSAVKLNDAVLRVWARVLTAVPGSRLVLKAAAVDSDDFGKRVAAAFAAEGVDAGRCTRRGETAGTAEHLAAYHEVDIALDPFPYNGTTTTLEAIHMGVPVVALAGSSHRARVGVSLLSNLGLADLVAADEAGYVRIAASLAADTAQRGSLRASLRGRLAASPICDREAFVQRVEGVYRNLWREYCKEPGGAGA